MIGNHFKIVIQDCKNGLTSFSEHDKILNFYGYQRFGSKRPVTHLIGKAIVQKNFKKAVELILSFTSTYMILKKILRLEKNYLTRQIIQNILNRFHIRWTLKELF